ncbi:MAG: imidazolonepropionase, partial [Porticoccaceae bacterium]
LNGASYQDIANAGGGIRSTVAATRAASEQELLDSAGQRLTHLLNEGVTSVEIKSGYGLDTEHELRMLRVARALEQLHPVSIRTTFLGAHALPDAYQDRPQNYINLVCNEMLPAVAKEGLADAVDAFCETIAFTPAQTKQVFDAAKQAGLPVKLHADQLSDSGGGMLAAEYGALSADHLEYTSEASIEAMQKANVVAVLLPGAFYYLRETQLPPIELLRKHRVPVAIATDTNPGSSPTSSLLLMLNMACTLFRLRPEEAFAGVTVNAAKALGLESDRGSLAVGKRADFALWDVADMAELGYWMGTNKSSGRVKDGVFFG